MHNTTMFLSVRSYPHTGRDQWCGKCEKPIKGTRYEVSFKLQADDLEHTAFRRVCKKCARDLHEQYNATALSAFADVVA